MVTHVNNGECYIFNGGVLTKDGHTFYELQNVHGHHVSVFGICVVHNWRVSKQLTLKAPNKNCSRRHFNFLLLSSEENKASFFV